MKRKKLAAGFLSLVMMTQSPTLIVSADSGISANFVYDDFTVDYKVTNSYGNTDVVNISLTNTGDKTIENWMLYFNPSGDIQYVTNAVEVTTTNGDTYFKNNGYNADITPGSTVTFTYAINDCTTVPDYYAFCQSRAEKSEGYDVSLSVSDVWGDSFNSSIVITNHTDEPIEAWELTIDTNFTITEITTSWAATVTELEPYSYMLKGTYTGTISANSSVSLGFIGVKEGEPEITSYSLTEVAIDEEFKNSGVNGSGEDDGFYDDCIDWSTMPDSDEDGLPDEAEEEYGCDPMNPDTDGDGLPDGYEILTVGSNPADAYSLDSTLSDGEYDNDQDGRNNYEEYQLETDPLLEDSDFDGLSDGDEVNVYGTDPLNPDTDGDGLSDGDEIALGLDPLIADSNEDGVPDNEELFTQSKTFDGEESDAVVQSIDIAFEGTGYIESTTFVESVMDVDWMCSNVVGLIGDPYDISSDSRISTGTITFYVDQNALGNSNFDNLAILWYDEENQRFVEMETERNVDNSTLTVTTEHFSKYLIVDCSRWYTAWSENNYPTNGNALHTAITIDCSDSMNWNDPEDENGNCYRKTAANGFVDSMHDADKASVILFHEDSVLKQSLTDDKDLLKTAISQMFENGYTNYDSALRTAIDSLDVDDNSDSDNIIIFLSDGVPTDNKGIEVDEINTSLVQEAKEKNIRIYTIGLTSNAREDILSYMAETTYGEYYYADTAQKLIEYFLTINMEEKYDITTDTDGDGLPDLFETYGIPVANGQVLFSDPENADTDGDGLLDGEEVIMHIVDSEEEVKAAYNYMYNYIPDVFISDNGGIYFTMVADPENEDTDGDGIVDGDEVDSPELEPYNNLDPLHGDTLSSLFGKLDNYKQNNVKTNAVYLELNENEITIMPRIYLLDEYQTKAFDISDEAQETYLKANSQASLDILARLDAQNLDYTLGNIFIDAIVDRWTTNFIGTSFDFLPGLDITTKVIPEVIYEKPADKKTRYIEVEIKKTFGGTSMASGGTDTTINKTIVMKGLGDEISIYEGICAHEFGHTLLIGDAYPTAFDNHNFTSVFNETSDHELYCVVDNSKYGRKDVGGGEIMLYNSDVLPNDIEMFLFGYTYNKKQYFVSDFSNKASVAIREYPNTYYYYSPHSYEFNDIYKENYSYSWYDNKGFIPTGVSIKNTEYDGIGYLYYEELDNDTITISILGLLDNSNVGSVTIPATVDGYTVTKISDGAFRNSNISGISFDNPSSIKTIGRYAFYNCKKLFSIDIPDGVEIIGSNTFENCSDMQQAKLPENLIIIDKAAFNACSNLSTVKLNEKILEIGNHAFYNCKNISEISFGENLKKIGKYALSATNIKSVSLPQNIVEIGEYAFEKCNNLESVTFNALEFNENRYNNALFQRCSSLRVVYVPSASYEKYCNWLSIYKQISITVVS